MSNLERIRQALESCGQNQGNIPDQIMSLFCKELGWGRPRGLMPRTLQPGAPVSRQVTAVPVAQMSDLPVYLVDWPDDRLPGTTARRAVQRALDPTHAEHVLVYVARNRRQLAFTRARQRSDGKIELRTLPYDVGSPARTTVERLAELAFSLDELSAGEPPITRVTDKLNAAFSVEAVTKQFYQEIASWYFWALDHVRFPKDAPKTDGKDHVSLIRLITRLIFCWFLKEKGLIPATLFDPKSLTAMLNGFAPHAMHDTSSVFYKAILQNLFFATLNTEMGRRDWAKDEQNFMAHNLYRHRELFRDPETALELFKDIPFLNGGLFECLDRIEGTKDQPRYIRIDGFSRRPDSQPVVPDALFFGEEREVDLSKTYGEARYRRTRVRGLMHTLASYNFTLTENTPFDHDVALDPELLGQVFENLLAAYNPETRTTARKATGSYYTPREIVDYMVEEALIACLTLKLETAIPDIQNVEARLRHLFAYNDEPHQFTDAEVEALIHAIDHLKILDPACGSGAFPMGILHKLVFILGRLDPGNARWKERQIAKAQEIPDPAVRDKVIHDIEQVFTANELDYGRKLYLIENCIYGVDIQPIAVQIAKLRFFISLVVDQRVNPNAENLGILALPNLETRFVAANTLIGIDRPQQLAFRNSRIDELERELARVREAHFTAKTPATKRKYRERDAALRAEIAEILKTDGWDDKTARMLAGWDPYDQNASASFFDPEWMFGIRDGFDIVIGNPPYVRQEEIKELKPLLQAQGYQCYTGTADLYVYFYERALNLLRHGGILSFISSNKFFRSAYGQKLRELLARQTLHCIIDFGDAPVFTAIAYPTILVLSKATAADSQLRALNWQPGPPVEEFPHVFRAHSFLLAQRELRPDGWRLESPVNLRLLDKLRAAGTPLGEYVNGRLYRGILTGLNEAFVVDRATRDRLIAEHPSSADVLKPFLRGRDIKRWRVEFANQYLIKIESSENREHPWSGKPEQEAERIFAKTYPAIHAWFERFRSKLIDRDDQGKYFWELRSCAYWREFERPKIVYPNICKQNEFAWEDSSFYTNQKAFIITEVSKYLLGILNSSVIMWLFTQLLAKLQNDFYEPSAIFMKKFPIPNPRTEECKVLETLVDRILAAKQANPHADVTNLEREIDERIYHLYGLTPEEIRIVEESLK
jgi:adenine-specific DNA-methyltransferase